MVMGIITLVTVYIPLDENSDVKKGVSFPQKDLKLLKDLLNIYLIIIIKFVKQKDFTF